MADDIYKDKVKGVSDPLRNAVAVTPSDTVDLATVSRALFVGVEGDVKVIMAGDSSSVVFKNASGLLPIMVSRVLATATTATNILSLN